MNFETFCEETKNHIKEFLPEEYAQAEVSLDRIEKINEIYTGLRVSKPGERVTPNINMDLFYEAYKNGIDVRDVIAKIVDIVTAPKPEFDINKLTNYEYVKDKLFVKVCNKEKNEEMLRDMPHETIEDIAITYHVLVNDGADGISSFAIRNAYLERYGIEQEQLHKDAMENAQKIMPAKIIDMNDITSKVLRMEMQEMGCSEEIILDRIEESKIPDNSMLVVGNEKGISGAATMFYPDIMEQLAERMDGDYYVFPSSVDEMIALKADKEMSIDELKNIVAFVNHEEVDEIQQLGFEVYHYDASDKVFELGSEYNKRMAEKEKTSEKSSVLKKLDNKKKEISDRVKDTVAPKKVVEATI